MKGELLVLGTSLLISQVVCQSDDSCNDTSCEGQGWSPPTWFYVALGAVSVVLIATYCCVRRGSMCGSKPQEDLEVPSVAAYHGKYPILRFVPPGVSFTSPLKLAAAPLEGVTRPGEVGCIDKDQEVVIQFQGQVLEEMHKAGSRRFQGPLSTQTDRPLAPKELPLGAIVYFETTITRLPPPLQEQFMADVEAAEPESPHDRYAAERRAAHKGPRSSRTPRVRRSNNDRAKALAARAQAKLSEAKALELRKTLAKQLEVHRKAFNDRLEQGNNKKGDQAAVGLGGGELAEEIEFNIGWAVAPLHPMATLPMCDISLSIDNSGTVRSYSGGSVKLYPTGLVEGDIVGCGYEVVEDYRLPDEEEAMLSIKIDGARRKSRPGIVFFFTVNGVRLPPLPHHMCFFSEARVKEFLRRSSYQEMQASPLLLAAGCAYPSVSAAGCWLGTRRLRRDALFTLRYKPPFAWGTVLRQDFQRRYDLDVVTKLLAKARRKAEKHSPHPNKTVLSPLNHTPSQRRRSAAADCKESSKEEVEAGCGVFDLKEIPYHWDGEMFLYDPVLPGKGGPRAHHEPEVNSQAMYLGQQGQQPGMEYKVSPNRPAKRVSEIDKLLGLDMSENRKVLHETGHDQRLTTTTAVKYKPRRSPQANLSPAKHSPANHSLSTKLQTSGRRQKRRSAAY